MLYSIHLCVRSTHLLFICVFLPHLFLKCLLCAGEWAKHWSTQALPQGTTVSVTGRKADRQVNLVCFECSVTGCYGCTKEDCVVHPSEVRAAQVH